MPTWLIVFLFAVGAVALFVVGMSLTLMIKGHNIDSEISTKEILRLSSDNSPVKYTVAISHACTAHQAGMRHDLAIIPDLHVLINVRKRMNRNVLPDLCA